MIENQPASETVKLLIRLEEGAKFFGDEGADYKKGEVYKQRFENLRKEVLEGKVYYKIYKALRDANTECNLYMS